TQECILRDVIHCPSAPCNLVSVSHLTDAGFHAKFVGNTVEVRSSKGTLLAIGDKVSRLYKLCVITTSPVKSTRAKSTHALVSRSWDEWH
ncbi:hypothetical protein L218DRAFT_886153, partial [Marasmius fiardii PR-910]